MTARTKPGRVREPKRSLKPVFFVMFRMMRAAPRRYFFGGILWGLFLTVPLLSGLVLKGLFDQLSGKEAAGPDTILWLCGAFVAVEAVRGCIFWFALTIWPYWWNASATMLRANALTSILSAPGPASTRLPGSSGEALSRFRDDANDLTEVTDNVVDIIGAAIFAILAFTVMANIDPVITIVLIFPMAVILVLNRLLRALVQRIHRRARELGAAVTAYIGEMFAGTLALKTAGAEAAAMERLRAHNRARRDAAVKDRLAMDMLDTSTSATIEIGVGLVLILAAPAMRRGEFTVGDLALFTTYVGWLAMLPRMVGKMLYRVPRGMVAIDRLTRLMARHETYDDLSRLSPIWFTKSPPQLEPLAPHEDRLAVLEARGLTTMHGDTGKGVFDVDLTIERGSFTVVTGAVGAGKTTLARALLGLLPLSSGQIAWNGRPVDDPGTFLVPRHAAYAGQVPRLFSESLKENLLLGWPATPADLTRALELAALDSDLAEMPAGLSTVVGPRGVRLSGGQIQRATAARALVRDPDLLVVDDLSSALDVQTENLLWERISTAARAGRGPETLIVISHRRAALERADQVVVLDRGRTVGVGPLHTLLRTCPEMQRLWTEEGVVEAEEL